MDRVSFSESVFEADEGDEVLEVFVILQRPSNLSRDHDVVVTVQTRDLAVTDSAKGLCFQSTMYADSV